MFERFTPMARRIAVRSQEEARVHNHDQIGTGHFLLALLDESVYTAGRDLEDEPRPHALAILRAVGVPVASLRESVGAAMVRGAEPLSGHIPFTDQVKKSLELTLREALALGHNYISTVHLLLGIVRQGDEAPWFARYGVDLPRLRAETRSMPQRNSRHDQPAGRPAPQRVVSAPKPVEPVPGGPAREAARLAHKVAIAFGHNYIGTEHVLLALLDVDDPAGLCPADLLPPRVTAEVVRDHVVRITGEVLGGATRPVPSLEVEEAYRIAEQLARSGADLLIRPLHTLAAITGLDGSVARAVATNVGMLDCAVDLLDRPVSGARAISPADRLILAALTGRWSEPPRGRHSVPDPTLSFANFTDRAKRVIVLAQEEARMLNHNHIGTEHLLLALIHESEGIAAQALETLNISLDAARQQAEDIVGQGQAAPTGHIPFSPRARNTLELAIREASQLGHNYIGTEHLMLALTRQDEGVAVHTLARLGADRSRIRQQVYQLMTAPANHPVGPAPVAPLPPTSSVPRSGLSTRAWATAHARTLAPVSHGADHD